MGRGDIVKLGRIKFNVKDYRTRFTGNTSSAKKDLPGEGNVSGEQV